MTRIRLRSDYPVNGNQNAMPNATATEGLQWYCDECQIRQPSIGLYGYGCLCRGPLAKSRFIYHPITDTGFLGSMGNFGDSGV